MKERNHLPKVPSGTISNYSAGKLVIREPDNDDAWIAGIPTNVDQ